MSSEHGFFEGTRILPAIETSIVNLNTHLLHTSVHFWSGGGTTNPEFVRRLREGDRSEEDPNSPRNVMNAFYFKPPFRVPEEREEVLLSSILSTKVAEGNIPGGRDSF